MNNLLASLSANDWVIRSTLVILLGLGLHWLARVTYRRILAATKKTKVIWDDALVHSIHAPILTFIWGFIISILVPIFLNKIGVTTGYTKYFGLGREVLFLLTFLWFTLRFIKHIEASIMHGHTKSKRIRDKTSARAITQLSRISIIIIAILVGMQTLGISIGALLTVGGIGGIAIGFAAKDTLANFLGGMMIFWDRPFSVGDWIRSPDRQIEGTVEDIGWRLTRIRTFDKRPLYVPNGTFSTISIENPSRMTNRRIKTNIGLRYDDATKMKGVLEGIEKMLRNHPEIDSKQTLMVNLIEFGPSSLNFFIYTFTKTTDWVKFQAVQQDVFLKVIDIVTQHGAEFAFPTSTLHVPQGLNIFQGRGEGVDDHTRERFRVESTQGDGVYDSA